MTYVERGRRILPAVHERSPPISDELHMSTISIIGVSLLD